MPKKFFEVCSCTCLGVLLSAASCGGTPERVARARSASTPESVVSIADTTYHLDLRQPAIVQPIEVADGPPESMKFVQVEVSAAENPLKHPMVFQLHFLPKTGEAVLLGSFSLYPSDNPGTFIVATQGRLRAGGAIRLSLTSPPGVSVADRMRAVVKRLRFLSS